MIHLIGSVCWICLLWLVSVNSNCMPRQSPQSSVIAVRLVHLTWIKEASLTINTHRLLHDGKCSIWELWYWDGKGLPNHPKLRNGILIRTWLCLVASKLISHVLRYLGKDVMHQQLITRWDQWADISWLLANQGGEDPIARFRPGNHKEAQQKTLGRGCTIERRDEKL